MSTPPRMKRQGTKMTAAEHAMQDIKALMDEYFSDTSRIVEVDVCMRLARIVGRYDMERIGEDASGTR